MPLGPLEAAGAGAPVILSDIAGHQFLKEVSFPFSLNSLTDGARQIEKIYNSISKNDGSLYQDLWNRSESLRTRFSVDYMTGRYESIYRLGKFVA